MFFTYAGAGGSATDLTTLANTISAAWNTNISPQVSTVYTLTSIQITDLTSASSPQIVLATNRVGTAAGANLPAGTATVIRFKVSRRYRGGHPRFYLGGALFTYEASAIAWTSVYINALLAAWQAFVAACILSPPTNIGALNHANVSYYAGFTNRTFPSGRTRPVPTLRGIPAVDQVTSYVINPNIASQRRRNLQSA